MLLHRIWLQRRRHYVVTLAVALAGLVWLRGTPGEIAGGVADRDPAVTGPVVMGAAVLALCALLLTAAVVALAPTLRRWCETLALATLVCVLAAHAVPGALAGTSPVWRAVGWASVALILYVGLYGDWWTRLPVRFNWTARRRFLAHCPPQAAWARLVPDPAHPQAHYSGLFLSQEAVEGHPNRVLQRTQADTSPMTGADAAPDPADVIETLLDIETSQAPHDLRYAYHSPHTTADYARGRFQLTITPCGRHGRHSLVAFSETVESLTPSTALDLWFDDFGSEIRSSMRSALNDRRDPTLWKRHRTASRAAETG